MGSIFRIFGMALAAGILLGFGCTGAVADHATGQSTGKLLLTGSSTMGPMLVEITKRFEALHPGTRFEVQMGGSGRGINDARAGKNDIGMVSRTLTDKESDVYEFPIARDGVAVVLHRDNPVQALADQQLRDIYTGKITNWKKVGGHDTHITVITGEAGRGSTEFFNQYLELREVDIKASLTLGDNPERFKTLLNNPDAIIYVSVGEAERREKAGTPIKLLPVGGVAATSKNIRSGNYPISRPLILVTKNLPTGLIKEFITFSLSSQVTDIILKYDFVPYLD